MKPAGWTANTESVAPSESLRPGKASGVVRKAAKTVREINMGMRIALEFAIASNRRVNVVLRGDPMRGYGSRMIEGTPTQFRAARDGRDRIVIAAEDGTEQLVLLDRVVAVLPVT